MPPVSDAFMVKVLMDLGPYESQAGQWEAITPTTLKDWMDLTGYHLGPWQCETIMRASKAFVSSYRAKSKTPPWRGAVDKKALSTDIKKAFRAIARK